MRFQGHSSGDASQRGFTLIEVLTAAVIAVIAVMGLAYSFSAGRGLIDRYAAARDGLAAAEARMERLSILGMNDPLNLDLSPGPHGPFPRPLNGNTTGTEQWTVTWVDDPADNIPSDANPNDYKHVSVQIRWMAGTVQENVTLDRVILGY